MPKPQQPQVNASFVEAVAARRQGAHVIPLVEAVETDRALHGSELLISQTALHNTIRNRGQ